MSHEGLDQKTYDKLFEQVREIVRHEDQLVNARLGWNMTFNGFLYAALAALLLTNAGGGSVDAHEVPQTLSQTTLPGIDVYVCLIVVSGLASATTTVLGVSAAFRAIRYAARRHNEVVNHRVIGGQILVWDVMSKKDYNTLGMVSGMFNPIAVALPWVVLALHLVRSTDVVLQQLAAIVALLLTLIAIPCAFYRVFKVSTLVDINKEHLEIKGSVERNSEQDRSVRPQTHSEQQGDV